jgi:hypothetical protein
MQEHAHQKNKYLLRDGGVAYVEAAFIDAGFARSKLRTLESSSILAQPSHHLHKQPFQPISAGV